MKIVIDKPMYVDREAVCKHLGDGSKFLGSWAIKDRKGNWSEQPIDVFYNPNPPHPFTNVLVGYYTDWKGEGYVCNATSSLAEKSMLCIVEDDLVYVSKYRHDFVKTPKGLIIDGGRDYLHTNAGFVGHFLSFDDSTGNFMIASKDAHGYQLVEITYKDENAINKQ